MMDREKRAVPASGSLIPLDQIRCAPDNPRWGPSLTAEREMVESVRAHGIIQPILVRPIAKDGTYEIVAGHRRYAAARTAGLREIPATIRDLTDAEASELRLVENLQREGLHPLEEARGYQRLMRPSAKYTVARIAECVGRSARYVYDRVRLLGLTKKAQEDFLAGRFEAGHAVLLARLSPADQARAMDPDHGGLYEVERLLWDPEKKKPADHETGDEDWRGLKPRSVGELRGWIDKHVRFNADADDVPDLFPETAKTVKAAAEQAEKIVHITHEYQAPGIPAETGQRLFTQRSWRRADGKQGSKTCEHAVTGVIVIGPHRGEAFRVCTEKKKCKVHWAAEQREAKKRAKAAARGGATGEDRWKIEQRKRQEAQKLEEAKRARFAKARPAILKALAEKVLKAPTGATGQLADILVAAVRSRWGGNPPGLDQVPRGKTAEDLVRHAAFTALAYETAAYTAWQDFPKRAKAFGVDVAKILDEVAPTEKLVTAKHAKAALGTRGGGRR